MYMVRLLLASVALVTAGVCAAPKKDLDPKISSIYPMTAQRGKTLEVVLRGSNLADARALMFEGDGDGDGVEARILSQTPEPAPAGEDTTKDRPKDLLRVDLVKVQ